MEDLDTVCDAEIYINYIITILLYEAEEKRYYLSCCPNPCSVKVMEIIIRASNLRKLRARRHYMTRYAFILIVLILISGSLSGDEPQQPGSTSGFSGTVTRHEDFQHELPGGLVFILEFISYGPEGWAIRIFDPAFPSDNFCAVVTPPYRGINALQIYAWHFLNADGTGPNDGSVDAPGEERRFYFVTDKGSYDTAFESLSAMLWPESPEAQETASALHDGIHRESGILTITELVAGDYAGDSAYIDSMEFDVELFIPPLN